MPKKNELVGMKARPVPKDEVEIGVDTKDTFQSDILEAGETSQLDLGSIQSFSQVSQTREQIYSLIDQMSQDPIIAASIETYAEDCTETNDRGQVMWCESSDENVNKYVTYLLNSLNVDKHIYGWAYSLIRYGDLYLKLFRKSEYKKKELLSKEEQNKPLNEDFNLLDGNFGWLTEEELAQLENKGQSKALKEDVNVKIPSYNDHYVHYVEAVANPGEMFELTKLGKTYAYIKAPTSVQQIWDNNKTVDSYLRYRMRKRDVTVYSPTDFVHACLQDNSPRTPEEVNIFNNNTTKEGAEPDYTYTVKRGQSLFYNIFRIWREMSLLENSILLNRLTRSSVVRAIQVEIGQMPKEKVQTHLAKIKSLFEQKSAINVGKGMAEYTNPGPIENNVFIPTRNGIGAIKLDTVGGTEYDPKKLTDLEHFEDKMFGAIRIPKQFLGKSGEGTFDSGKSLAIQSARYAKAVKRIQNTLCQCITDLINLFLLDKKLTNYINKFTLRMQAPITQAEIEKRENDRNSVGVMSDIMNALGDISQASKLKIMKNMLTNVVNDPEITSILTAEIDKLEKQEKAAENPPEEEGGEGGESVFGGGGADVGEAPSLGGEEGPAPEAPAAEGGDEGYLPNPAELGIDATGSGEGE